MFCNLFFGVRSNLTSCTEDNTCDRDFDFNIINVHKEIITSSELYYTSYRRYKDKKFENIRVECNGGFISKISSVYFHKQRDTKWTFQCSMIKDSIQ